MNHLLLLAILTAIFTVFGVLDPDTKATPLGHIVVNFTIVSGLILQMLWFICRGFDAGWSGLLGFGFWLLNLLLPGLMVLIMCAIPSKAEPEPA